MSNLKTIKHATFAGLFTWQLRLAIVSTLVGITIDYAYECFFRYTIICASMSASFLLATMLYSKRETNRWPWWRRISYRK